MTVTSPAHPDIPIWEHPASARTGLLRIGTRGSRLALAQAGAAARDIARATGLDVGLVVISTQGDRSTAPLSQLGGTGVFVSALRTALLDGSCDLAIHSFKDLPTGDVPGIAVGAVPGRADARDALIAGDRRLATLRPGASVGTGSPRRAAQLRSRRPDLDVRELRGNIDSRLARVGVDLDAVVLAAAGLDRIGRSESISERFPLSEVPSAPGQGALAVEVRADDDRLRTALSTVDDPEAHACVVAERALLATLEAGCAAPVGAWARFEHGRLRLTATVYHTDGGRSITTTRALERPEDDGRSTGLDDARALGVLVATALLADGARDIAPLGSLG